MRGDVGALDHNLNDCMDFVLSKIKINALKNCSIAVPLGYGLTFQNVNGESSQSALTDPFSNGLKTLENSLVRQLSRIKRKNF
jgi:hypothetical protein